MTLGWPGGDCDGPGATPDAPGEEDTPDHQPGVTRRRKPARGFLAWHQLSERRWARL